VDTAPLMEKPLAAQTAMGWQGKHSCVVSREYGSWLFLGEILTSLDLPADQPERDHCGKCTRCLDICPTAALDAERQIDARKCISYLTIEHKGHIDTRFRKAIGNRIYGCDDCLAVCPWNKFAQISREAAYHARAELPTPRLAELLVLDDDAFRKRFAGSPIKRIKRDRFLRNVLIAAGNSNNRELLPLITPLLTDASPLVRAMAVWALRQLASADETLAFAQKLLPNEQDPNVLEEWRSTYG
jgi:epoxyqueuosine reductase